MIQNWLEKSVMMRMHYITSKKMCIDFRKNQICPKAVYNKGEPVERVETSKYLGAVLDRRRSDRSGRFLSLKQIQIVINLLLSSAL